MSIIIDNFLVNDEIVLDDFVITEAPSVIVSAGDYRDEAVCRINVSVSTAGTVVAYRSPTDDFQDAAAVQLSRTLGTDYVDVICEKGITRIAENGWLIVIIDGQSDSIQRTLLPKTGWSHVTLTSVASEGALETDPALAIGDQVYYNNVGTLVEVFNDGSVAFDSSVESFDYQVHGGAGWGSVGTITLLPPPVITNIPSPITVGQSGVVITGTDFGT